MRSGFRREDDILVDEMDLHVQLIQGDQSRRLRYRRSVFSTSTTSRRRCLRAYATI
jgi:hypothetical protein